MNKLLDRYLEQLQIQNEAYTPGLSSAVRARAWRLMKKMAKSKDEAKRMYTNFIKQYNDLHIKSRWR